MAKMITVARTEGRRVHWLVSIHGIRRTLAFCGRRLVLAESHNEIYSEKWERKTGGSRLVYTIWEFRSPTRLEGEWQM
jgi:hypothetical protein